MQCTHILPEAAHYVQQRLTQPGLNRDNVESYMYNNGQQLASSEMYTYSEHVHSVSCHDQQETNTPWQLSAPSQAL